ncbi:MAG: glycosyltransferase family 2 protein [Thermoguttaceae bacterium]
MFFAFVYFVACRKPSQSIPPKNHITLLVPAHNESNGLQPVLTNLQSLQYPSDLFSIIVLADNCTDDTAQIAKNCGILCLERFDSEKRGKGEALVWAIPQVLESGQNHNRSQNQNFGQNPNPNQDQNPSQNQNSIANVRTDAVMIVDADCFLDPDTLLACNAALEQGHKALQIANLVGNSDASFRCYAMSLARVIECLLYYWPKSRLGLSVPLLGTGMLLHREILEKFPWCCGGIAEDMEYSFVLLKNNVIPQFLGEVGLTSPFPVDSKTLEVQRSRWVFGGLKTMKESLLTLMQLGMKRRDIRLIDAGISAVYTSRPVVLAQVALSLLFSLLAVCLAPSKWSLSLLGLTGLTIVLYSLYILLGIYVLGLNRKRFGYLLFLPVFVCNYLTITLKSLLFRRPKTWERTPRES